MTIRVGRVFASALISLLALLSVATQSSAQNRSPRQTRRLIRLLDTRANGSGGEALATPGSGHKVLYNFGASPSDGVEPDSSLVRDAAGNLYGTTLAGGAYSDSGTVFKVDTAGNETVLYSFCAPPNCADGFQPSGVIQDGAGNLDGTTNGVVFRLSSPGWTETTLYTFGDPPDGAEPLGNLIEDGAGNLYGTTFLGGTGGTAAGTVFEVDTAGHETVLYNFCSRGGTRCTDGAQPEAGLIRDAAGNLYGTTAFGGANSDPAGNGGGVGFEVDTAGQETILYNFCSVGSTCNDGDNPDGPLIRDAAGNLYGATLYGGSGSSGVVFRVDTAGHETVLYNFCSVGANCTDGSFPEGDLIQDAAGNLYGTTLGGGNINNGGVVFKLAAPQKQGGKWSETILYTFCSKGGSNCTDGDYPEGGLILDSAGNLYGTTGLGGVNTGANNGSGGGTLFVLSTSGGGGGGATATVTLTSTPNPSKVGQSVTFTAVVSGKVGTPTGTVMFKQGKKVLGTVTLVNGQAILTATFPKAGTFSIIAAYSGDQNYKPKNSKPLKQVVQ